jgi:PAS domain S-box-containing protein
MCASGKSSSRSAGFFEFGEKFPDDALVRPDFSIRDRACSRLMPRQPRGKRRSLRVPGTRQPGTRHLRLGMHAARMAARVVTSPLRRSDRLIHTAAIVLSAAIFTTDLQLPLANAVGMLYVPVILLGLWTGWRRYPVVAAVSATTLLALTTVVAWTADVPPIVYINRPLMVTLCCVTAALVLQFKGLQRQSLANVDQLADIKRALDAAAIVATTDVSGRITYVNDKFVEISGYSRDELLGQDHRIINSGYHSKEFIRDLWRTIASGRVWHGELRNRAKDGHYYWVDTTIVPFLNERGKPYQYVAIRADITARKAAEEKLAHQAALARVGQMAAVVAHEVRNPLAGVKGAIQILMSRRSAGDAELPVMRDIVARIDALSELINDLMIFARPRPPRLARVELHAIIADAITVARRDPAAHAIDISIDGPGVTIDADGELIRAMLLNLLLNAAQAMALPKGRIVLRTAQKGNAALIEVRDTGPGIPADIRTQIFEPFFTTKARGGGLGLPIARRTAELHGGSLTIDCPTEGGTVVTVQLPIRPPLTASGDGRDSQADVRPVSART